MSWCSHRTTASVLITVAIWSVLVSYCSSDKLLQVRWQKQNKQTNKQTKNQNKKTNKTNKTNKQKNKCILLKFWNSELWNQSHWAEVKMLAELVPLENLGENRFLTFGSFGRPPAFVGL